MTVIDINRVSKRYAAETVLEEVSARIEQGEKIGLIGANGSGKSTLLKIIAGLEPPSAGTVALPTGATIGYVAQELLPGEGRTVGEEVAQAFAELKAMEARLQDLERAMSEPTGDHDLQQAVLAQYSRLAALFEQRGGYSLEHQVDAVLQGLGLVEQRHRPMASLSGGEKNLVALARALLTRPEILLLDEPANHLDFAGLEWLEEFLKGCEQTVVLVSHNRYLLDRVVGTILELERHHLARYPGNYSRYRVEKTRSLLAQQAAYDSQQKEIQRLERMIRRFERWASMTNDPRQSRRARNKQRVLDRLERVERPDLDPRGIDPRFVAGDNGGAIALQLKGYSHAFGDRQLFDRVELHLRTGDRVGLLGANGSGKSTLFREIVGRAAWDDPVLRIGPRVRLGYYAQEHETLDPGRTILAELLTIPGLTRDRAFGVLHRFLFEWRDLDRLVGTLSGGEKSRVQLAKLMVSGANLLLLDEPTNHLDLFSRERVEEALEEFDGTLLVISHDRYFLDRIVDRIVELESLRLTDYPGGFTCFWEKKRQRTAPAVSRTPRPGRPSRREARPRTIEPPDAARLEAEIEALEARRHQLEHELLAAGAGGGERLVRALHRLEAEIEERYAQWEQAADR
jgi:ATPase subunit of ABC transporter with duplicated ATPase domains